MQPTRFELTSAQKGMLASLMRETGKPTATLLTAIAVAMEELEEREYPSSLAHEEPTDTIPEPRRERSFGEIAATLLADVPEEVFTRLPSDGATQHDHYIYGTPRRPA